MLHSDPGRAIDAAALRLGPCLPRIPVMQADPFAPSASSCAAAAAPSVGDRDVARPHVELGRLGQSFPEAEAVPAGDEDEAGLESSSGRSFPEADVLEACRSSGVADLGIRGGDRRRRGLRLRASAAPVGPTLETQKDRGTTHVCVAHSG